MVIFRAVANMTKNWHTGLLLWNTQPFRCHPCICVRGICSKCLAFCKSHELWRYCRTYHLRKQLNDEKSTGVLAKNMMLLEGGLQEEGNITDKGMQDMHKHVLLVIRKEAAYTSLK